MALSAPEGAAVFGIDAQPIEVEVDLLTRRLLNAISS